MKTNNNIESKLTIIAEMLGEIIKVANDFGYATIDEDFDDVTDSFMELGLGEGNKAESIDIWVGMEDDAWGIEIEACAGIDELGLSVEFEDGEIDIDFDQWTKDSGNITNTENVATANIAMDLISNIISQAISKLEEE